MAGPYQFTASHDLNFAFEGDQVVMRTGDTRQFTDPCTTLRFVNAARAATGEGVGEESQGVFAELEAECAAGGAPAPTVDPPPTPPPTPDPSATAPDTAPPADGETPETLGGPDPATGGDVSGTPRAPGEADERPLAEQVYDPRDPLPVYDLPPLLSALGVPGGSIDDAITAILHNEPPAGEPHPFFGLDDRLFPSLWGADPVNLYTGQFTLSSTDIRIPSRGFPLYLSRLYRSGAVSFGPWGFNWDHNYNVFLRPLKDGGAAVWNGALSEDVFPPGPNSTFESPTGVFRQLERHLADIAHPEQYVLSDVEGMLQIFEQPPGWPHGDRFPLVRIEDRHGNAHALSYDAEGRLDRVQDHAGRFLQFSYGDCGLLESVADHTARVWRYFHDGDAEHLVAVVTPGTAEYPEGHTMGYEYGDRFREHPALRHNITRVTDPSGRVTVENEYGDDPGSDDFNRVVYQQVGGYEVTMRATRLQYVPRAPDAINVPALRVEYVDPGVLYVYTFNYRGDLLDERFRLALDESYRLVARTYRYDEVGNLAERREPNGLGMLATYDATHVDPRARGNILKRELVAPPTTIAASRIIQHFTYEPQFNRLKTLRDEAGGVTTFVYDYEFAPGGHGDVVRIDYPPATLPDGSQQPRAESFTYNAFGQLTEHRTGAGHRHVYGFGAAGPSNGYLTSITWDAGGAAQVQSIEYDGRGHRTAFVDGLGNRTESTIDELDRVTRIRLPAVAGVVDDIRMHHTPEGQVRREEWPRGTYNDSTIADPFIAHEYAYDVLGRRVAASYGVNTAAPTAYRYEYTLDGKPTTLIDPLGRTTRYTYDERGLMMTVVEATGTPREAAWLFAYDRNGNRLSTTDPAGHRFDKTYDAWDRPIRLTLPGAPDPERTRLEFTLNRFDKVERVRVTGLTSPGVVGVLLDSTTDYDERGRPWRRRLGAREAVSTYDADERVLAQVDQRGNGMQFVFDGLNRIVQGTDALGNVVIRTYDAAGNLTRIENQEVLPGGGLESLVTTIGYDGRLRPVQVTTPLGSVSTTTYDARGLAVQSMDPLGRIVTRTFGSQGELTTVESSLGAGIAVVHTFAYDAVGRQVSYTDPEGRVSLYEFDERDRRTAITYPDGRRHQFFYDQRRQVAREQTPGGTLRTYTYGADAALRQTDFLPAAGVAPTPSLMQASDGLRRIVQTQQGGPPLTRTFDQSLRLRSETYDGSTLSIDYDDAIGAAVITYADGRQDRLNFDPLGRIARVTLATVGTAGLTGALAAGTTVANYTYRGSERLAHRDLHTGVVSLFDYDAGARLTALRHSDAAANALATTRYVYDVVERRRVAWSAPAPGAPTRFDFDPLSRVTRAAIGLPIAEPGAALSQAAADAVIAAAQGMAGPTDEQYVLNRSDARTAAVRTSPTGVATDTYTLTPSYQITSLNRLGLGAANYPFTFDGDGRCTQDERYQYRYDALDRLVEVRSLPGLATVLSQSFDPAGRVAVRTEGGAAYRQLYLGLRLLERRDATGNPWLQFTSGGGTDEVLMESDGANRYPLQDAHSSVLACTDAAATILERYSYTPFGEPSVFAPDGVTSRPSSAIGGIVRFGGHPFLAPGLYDARARVYDPRTGRFLQPDPLGYKDAANLYVYVHHDPIGFVDPTGEAGILIGLLVAAGVGLLVGGGMNAVRQGIQIHEGSRKEFSWGELGLSAGVGAVLAPVLVVAPELAIPLSAYGVAGGAQQIAAGNWETGTFDIVTSLAPFGFKSVRSATFGEGSVFAPVRGLGPSATAAARFGRIPALGRSTSELVGRVWNERFYRGTTYYEALGAEAEGLDLVVVRNRQTSAASPPRLGSGLYFTREPGPGVPGSASYWADYHGTPRGGAGGPAVLEGSIPRWRVVLMRDRPGVQLNVEQPGFPVHPASRESFFPFEGPNNLPPSGPGAEFNALARWRIWDPNAPQPDLSGLAPTLLAHPSPWGNPPGAGTGSK